MYGKKHTRQDMHSHHAEHSKTGAGMWVMAVMMGFCFGGVLLGALTPAVDTLPALVVAASLGFAFAALSILYHRLMGPLMGVCCAAPVLVGAVPSMGLALGGGLALLVGVAVGVGSQRMMNREQSRLPVA